MTEFVWPVMDPAKGTWFGSEGLKAWALERMVKHRQADELIRGYYQEATDTPSGYRGCLIGCTLPRRIRGQRRPGYMIPGVGFLPAGSDPEGDIETLYGIPEGVANLLERVFEATALFETAADFAVESIRSIPVGVVYPEDGWPYYEDPGGVLDFLRTKGVPA